MGRVVSIFYYPRATQLLHPGGLWRVLFADGRASVVLEPAGMNVARKGKLDGIGSPGLVSFAGLGVKDTAGVRESTLYGLNSKTQTRKCLSWQGRRS